MNRIAYLRSSYGIPAKKGMRVKLKKAYFNIPSDGGVITGSKNGYLAIRVDGEKHSRLFHPTYGVIYLNQCPECNGRGGFNNAGGATSCSACHGTGIRR